MRPEVLWAVIQPCTTDRIHSLKRWRRSGRTARIIPATGASRVHALFRPGAPGTIAAYEGVSPDGQKIDASETEARGASALHRATCDRPARRAASPAPALWIEKTARRHVIRRR